MKYDEVKIKEDILNYLYECRESSPQSMTKIRIAVDLRDTSKGDVRTLKSCVENLLRKGFIKKQVDRGNYKIEQKGIEHIEKQREIEQQAE
ncbi:MAG: hypothetical protein RSA29_06795 [Clostridium sp.]|uniref:hypothetical protein n=1 Tax=Clostridium sp. TaxID=1506 RepID=UPI00302642D4